MSTVHLRLVVFTFCLAVSMSATGSVTVGANMKSVVHKSSNGLTIAFPDVCKTPSPAGPIPIPYPNIAMSSEEKTPTKVKVSAKQPVATKDSTKTTTGDQIYSGARIETSNVRERINPVLYSLNVKSGGQLHIRQYDERSQVTSAPDDARVSVTEVTYVDASGKKLTLREPTLIELANGEYCAVCVVRGKVTRVYRLLPDTPKSR